MKKFIYTFITIVIVALFTACGEDDLEPTMAQDKVVETSINNIEDMQGVLRGTYNRMTSYFYYGRDFIIYGEVRSDNCYANTNSGRFLTPAAMDMGETDAYARDTWAQMYSVIATANIIISKDGGDIEGDAAEINQAIGQAYAIRALAHFDLLKLFGQQHAGGTLGIPYITEYKGEDLTPARLPVAEVKTRIEADIASSLSFLTAAQDDGTKEYFTTAGAQALKARVAIYFGDWSTAITACEAVINTGDYSIVPQADFVNSWVIDGAVNSIFELAFSNTDNQNINGLQYMYRGAAYGDVRVLADLQGVFTAGDVRNSAAMIGLDPAALSYLANRGKYPALDYSDNVSIFRYEEVILNYAEALFETGGAGIAGNALYYLNLIPAQRGLGANYYAAASKANILLERRKELCFEGFRFDDLARTGQAIPVVDAIRQTHGGPAYGSYKYAFPIPKVELNANPNMVQNTGY